MKNKIIKFIFLVSLFVSMQGFANPINKIDFVGLNVISHSSLLELLPVKIGDEYNEQSSNRIIKALFNTEYFSDINVENNNGNLIITFIENPTIKYINVKIGPDKNWTNWLDFSSERDLLDDSTINASVQSHKLSAGEFYNKKNLTDFITYLNNQYSEAGFYNVKITQNIEIDSKNRAAIEIEINQGNRSTIGSITISGASKFSQKELLKLFTIGEADMILINYFTHKDRYSDLALNQGIELLNNYYFNSGYIDFQVESVESTLSEDKKKIYIDIKISEGIQYKLGKVFFQGELGNQTPDSLRELLTIQTGDIFNFQEVVSDIQTITDIYTDQGYAFVNINPITKDILDTVDVNIEISLNKKVYVNRITISGNTRTQDDVIRREIGISEGGLYSRSTLRNSVIKLRRLGYFSDVQMNASKVDGMPDKIDLNFVLEETKTGTLSASLSHSNSFGFSIGAGITEKNIFGSGNTFNADLKISESFNKLSFYFKNPYFNNDNHSISYGAFISRLDDDDIMKDSYNINSKGFSVGYGVPLANNTRLNGELEYAKHDIACGSIFSTSGYESNQCATSSNDEVKLSLFWNETTLNDYLYPTAGKSNVLEFGVATPLGDYRYFNLNANHKSYKSLSEDVTLKITGDIGLAKGYGGKELPFFKRYFGGGSGSVRGFGNKTFGPLYPNNSAKGGELSILGSANIITTAYFFDDNDKMRLSAFVDVGNIYEKTSNIKLGDLRMSTGVGFAYLSPIGAIGIYWAEPILKKSGDVVENFGVSLGTGF